MTNQSQSFRRQTRPLESIEAWLSRLQAVDPNALSTESRREFRKTFLQVKRLDKLRREMAE